MSIENPLAKEDQLLAGIEAQKQAVAAQSARLAEMKAKLAQVDATKDRITDVSADIDIEVKNQKMLAQQEAMRRAANGDAQAKELLEELKNGPDSSIEATEEVPSAEKAAETPSPAEVAAIREENRRRRVQAIQDDAATAKEWGKKIAAYVMDRGRGRDVEPPPRTAA